MVNTDATPATEDILTIESLWKVFGPDADDLLENQLRFADKEEILEKTGCVLALRDITLAVRRGEFFVIMGLSGSGKSTLIRCLLRLIEPTSGSIVINGEDICRYDQAKLMGLRRHTISMVFQHFGLFPHYTVLDNVTYGLKIRGASRQERHDRAMEAIALVGLKGWENHLPEALSGGMQQRVGLARALATDPQILLMDEPFSGLDPLIRRQMQDELVELQDKLNKTIIFVTHDLHEAFKLGGRIAIMRNGEVIQIGSPEDVITAPANDYVRDFMQDASPAKVLTAGWIMEEPELLLYEWQGLKTARHLLRATGEDYAFVVGKHHELLGIVTRELLDQGIRDGRQATVRDVAGLVRDLPRCGPDVVIEELFPLATAGPYPIPVLNENDRFLGQIRNRTILDSMIQERVEEEENQS
ncbi:MAG: glycine betaine/L-proline ABC transporter ATP-binding protein [Desulfobulbus sp.]|nr:glycine betaine/L-proline ABC transporter ATP-binding protein [Desulfobulbus sp.]